MVWHRPAASLSELRFRVNFAPATEERWGAVIKDWTRFGG